MRALAGAWPAFRLFSSAVPSLHCCPGASSGCRGWRLLSIAVGELLPVGPLWVLGLQELQLMGSGAGAQQQHTDLAGPRQANPSWTRGWTCPGLAGGFFAVGPPGKRRRGTLEEQLAGWCHGKWPGVSEKLWRREGC